MGGKKKICFSCTWHAVGVLLLVYAICFEQSFAENLSSNEKSSEDEDCERVPPFSKPKDDGIQVDLKYLVTQGEEFLENHTTTSDAILVLGNTGSGKSTLTQILAGDLSRLHAVLTPGNRLVIIDYDDRIGVPSTESKTLVPEQVLKTESDTNLTKFAFYDCPGFADTRGPTHDIAANFFMNTVTKKIQNVKMLFLATHSSVKTGNDRIDFDSLVKHAVSFVKSLNKFKNSFALIVTKVDNFNSRGRYISDRSVIDEIVDFLKNYNQTLHFKLDSNDHNEIDLTKKKILFVEFLLEKDPSSKRYTKIWFLRSPSDCGPLSLSKTIIEAKSVITDLYEHLKYATVDSENDFSYTIKEHSLAYIGNLTKFLNTEIAQAATVFLEELAEKHFATKIQPKINGHMVLGMLTEMKRVADQLKKIHESLESQNITMNSFITTLRKIWNSFDESIPPKLEYFLDTKARYLNLLTKVSQTNQYPTNGDWNKPISKLLNFYNDKRNWYQFLVNLQTHVSSYNFQSRYTEPFEFSDSSIWIDYIENNTKLLTDQVKELANNAATVELQLLGKIMEFSTTKISVICTKTATIIHANFVAISSFTSHMKKCSTDTTQLYVYAAHTIFFDDHVSLVDIDLVLMAPNFKNPLVNMKTIDLIGKSADSITPETAEKGQDGKDWTSNLAQNGGDGHAGMPGNPGGAFFGVAGSTDSLTLISKGGNGGNGQNGGNGGSARTGNVPCSFRPTSTGREDVWFQCGTNTCRRFERTSEHSGYDGGNGGNGGNGGKAGIGGEPSKMYIIDISHPSKFMTKMFNGNYGEVGKGGAKGKGSSKANGYKKRGSDCKVKEAKKKHSGNDGRDGSTGISSLGMKSPANPRQLLEWPHLIQYKIHFFNYTNYETANFIEQLDVNEKFNQYFTLKFLAEEYLAFENIDQTVANPSRLGPILKSLIRKLENFSAQNYNKFTREYQKVINLLLTSAYSSLVRLETPSRLPAIVNIVQYFGLVRTQIKSLKTASAYAAVIEAKTEFTNDVFTKIHETTNLIDTTVTNAINQAGEDIDLQIAVKEQELSELISSSRLTLADFESKLQRDKPFKDLLTVVTTLGFMSDLALPYVSKNGFSTFSTIAKKLQTQFTGLPREMEKVEKLLEEGEKQLSVIKDKQEKFKQIIPHVTSALSFWRNISKLISKSDSIPASYLQINKWQIISKLKDCKYYLAELSDNALNLNSLINAFDRIQDAITLSIELYEIIGRYQELNSLVGYIEKVNSAALAPQPIRDPDLARTVANFDKTVRTNLLSLELQKVTHAFQQWVFPFAKMYFLKGFRVPVGAKLEIGDEQLRQVEHLETELQKYKASSVANHDEFIIQTEFSSDLKTSKPFFTWENDKWKKEIEILFSGTKVYLNADVRLSGKKGWEAIKFKLIEINFKLNHATQEMQTEFDDIIEYFGISMTHSGVSYYRFEDDFFVMNGQNQTLQYNFEKDKTGNRLGTNKVYEKFKRGDFMLSPYTLWTVQLLNSDPTRRLAKSRIGLFGNNKNASFEMLKKFIPYINIELVGIGTYVKGKETLRAAGGDLELDKWYERDYQLLTKEILAKVTN